MLEWRKVTDEKYNKNVDANFFAFLVFRLHFLFQGQQKKNHSRRMSCMYDVVKCVS